MRMTSLVLSVICVFTTANLSAGDFNVLVVGSTHLFAQQKDVAPQTKAKITAQVKRALTSDLRVRGRIIIPFDEVYRTEKMQTAYGGGGKMVPTEYHCHSLAQWFFWPKDRQERLDSLQGEGKTKWNAVVLVGDPYIVANMPGIYAESVNIIANAIGKGKATDGNGNSERGRRRDPRERKVRHQVQGRSLQQTIRLLVLQSPRSARGKGREITTAGQWSFRIEPKALWTAVCQHPRPNADPQSKGAARRLNARTDLGFLRSLLSFTLPLGNNTN